MANAHAHLPFANAVCHLPFAFAIAAAEVSRRHAARDARSPRRVQFSSSVLSIYLDATIEKEEADAAKNLFAAREKVSWAANKSFEV